MPDRRLLVLGFDGMDAALVRTWGGQGLLPNFQRLLETSAWCQFDLSPEFSSGMVWPTINTGLSPREHRAYFGTRIVEGTYRVRPRRPNDIRGTPFWQRFSDEGQAVVVADVPFARLLSDSDGTQIQGWGQHDWMGAPHSEPRGLIKEITRRFGAYPFNPATFDHSAHCASHTLQRVLTDAVQKRTELLQWLAGKQHWDLFYAVFTECHSAGHHLWPCTAAGTPDSDRNLNAASFDALRDVYRTLDDALGTLRNDVGPDSITIAILSHGMGPNLNGDHLFSELLRRFNSNWAGSPEMSSKDNLFNYSWQHTVKSLPVALRVAIRNRTPISLRRWISLKRKQQSRVWKHTLSFAIPGLDGFSAVRINMAGREPNGVIQPGEQYDQYVSDLVNEIGNWIDTDTGRPAVSSVYRADDDPTVLGPAPDIMLWWDKNNPLNSVESPLLGTVAETPVKDRTGEHIMHSLFLVQHPGAAAGEKKTIDGMTLLDIAPTIVELGGLETDPTLPGLSRRLHFGGIPPEICNDGTR